MVGLLLLLCWGLLVAGLRFGLLCVLIVWLVFYASGFKDVYCVYGCLYFVWCLDFVRGS